MDVPLFIDYCTFNVPEMTFTVDSLSSAVLPGCDLSFLPVGNLKSPNMYQSSHGINFQLDSGFNSEQVVRFSGSGCSTFACTFPSFYSAYNPRVSRLDLTFDFPMSVSSWRDFLKTVFCESMDSDRQRKVYNLVTGTVKDGSTVYIGSRRSPYFFRIYNKSLESGIPVSGDEYLIRFECELKRFRRSRSGEVFVYDPTSKFVDYFSDLSSLSNFLIDLWKSYCPEAFLPPGFDDFVFVYPHNFYFVAFDSVQPLPSVVCDQIFDHISDFNSSVKYVVDHFGASAIHALLNPVYRQQMVQAYHYKTGFDVSLRLELLITFPDDGSEVASACNLSSFILTNNSSE